MYEPKYRDRPTVQLAEEAAVAPVVYEGGIESAERLCRFANLQKAPPVYGAAGSGGGIGSGSGGGVGGGVFRSETALKTVKRTLVTDSTVAVSTEGSERGELFEYRFDANRR